MGKERSNGGIAGGGGCFLKPSKSLLHGWTFPHTTSGAQVAGKQSRRRARPASALGPHTGSQLLSSTLGTSIHTSLLPTAWLFSSARACMEHWWYRRESCAHSTEGKSSLDRRATSGRTRPPRAAHRLCWASIPTGANFSTSFAAQLTLEMPM